MESQKPSCKSQEVAAVGDVGARLKTPGLNRTAECWRGGNHSFSCLVSIYFLLGYLENLEEGWRWGSVVEHLVQHVPGPGFHPQHCEMNGAHILLWS